MNFLINKNKLPLNPGQFLRQAGYGFIIDNQTGNETFIRHFGAGRYPRFHMYVKEDENKIEFSLHLDQKKAMYAGQHAHSAEYDSPIVKTEVERLKDMLRSIYKKGA